MSDHEETSNDRGSPVGAIVEVSDLTGLGAATKALLGMIRDATGVLYRPKAIRDQGRAAADAKAYEMVALAKAKVEAATVLVDGRDELRLRAIERKETMWIAQQANVETNIARTVEKLEGDERPDEVRQPHLDWMRRYFQYVEDVSDEQLHDLWSSILARQMNGRRRSLSLLTLDALGLMEFEQALLFDKFARTYAAFGRCWPFEDAFKVAPSRWNRERSLIGRSDEFGHLKALEEMGFVEIKREQGARPLEAKLLNFHRYGVKVIRGHKAVPIAEVMPTFRGEELLRIVLRFGLEEEGLKLTDLINREQYRYGYLNAGQQAEVLRSWFRALAVDGCAIRVGLFPKGGNFMNANLCLGWEDERLVAVDGEQVRPDDVIPPEIEILRSDG